MQHENLHYRVVIECMNNQLDSEVEWVVPRLQHSSQTYIASHK